MPISSLFLAARDLDPLNLDLWGSLENVWLTKAGLLWARPANDYLKPVFTERRHILIYVNVL
jgi:hypothetical protein